jgi:hypothetical protein
MESVDAASTILAETRIARPLRAGICEDEAIQAKITTVPEDDHDLRPQSDFPAGNVVMRLRKFQSSIFAIERNKQT